MEQRTWIGRDGREVGVGDVVETLGGVVARVVTFDACGYAKLEGHRNVRYAPHLERRDMGAEERAAAVALVARLIAELRAPGTPEEKAERGRAGWPLLAGLPERVPVRDVELARALCALLHRCVQANAHVGANRRASPCSMAVLAAARPLIASCGYFPGMGGATP